MLAYKINSKNIKSRIFIPKYYDPVLYAQITALGETHELLNLGDLLDSGVITAQTGHEIGKMAYGTGNIPFVRTSDITNWEIKTIPKQGVSEDIYQLYAEKEDVQPGDILMVRDGTYLIGTNCIITPLDIPMVFQSHILKFRVVDSLVVDPYLLFLSFNCSLVQKQIKNMQFTADIIDTLGNRYRELILPIPKDEAVKKELITSMKTALETRMKYKAAVKQMPLLSEIVQDTTTLEFGEFSAYKIKKSDIVGGIFLPKYYDPSIKATLDSLSANCSLYSVQQLIDMGAVQLSTGDEIGKMAYGTGDIPFVRTSVLCGSHGIFTLKSPYKIGTVREACFFAGFFHVTTAA